MCSKKGDLRRDKFADERKRCCIWQRRKNVFTTIDDNRYNFMMLTEFESQWEVNVVEVPILGKVGMGHKAAGGKGTWSGTAHYNQSIFRKIADNYQKTGMMPYFEIQVSNEDPTSAAGTSTYCPP